MEGAEANMFPPPFFQRCVLGGNLDDRGYLPYLIDNLHIWVFLEKDSIYIGGGCPLVKRTKEILALSKQNLTSFFLCIISYFVFLSEAHSPDDPKSQKGKARQVLLGRSSARGRASVSFVELHPFSTQANFTGPGDQRF